VPGRVAATLFARATANSVLQSAGGSIAARGHRLGTRRRCSRASSAPHQFCAARTHWPDAAGQVYNTGLSSARVCSSGFPRSHG
jgi:hypothetical protein